MPVTHLVNVILRPGIQSIQVQYKYQSAEVWTNYNEGQRIPGGVEVKFTVTTYPNFTLTEWKAWYADEYDDTVNLTLTPITGESSWIFILPSADVYIRCESAGSHNWQFPEYVDGPTITITGNMSASEMANYVSANQHAFDDIPSGLLSDMVSRCGQYASSQYLKLIGFWYDANLNESRAQMHVSDTTPVSNTYNMATANFTTTIFNYRADGLWNSSSNWVYYMTQQRTGTTPYVGVLTHEHYYAFLSFSAGIIDSYSVSEMAIRYIISPENSGEIDADAPSVLVEGTTEFTFKWRIKTGYSLKRITPFAVGDGSLEDDVLYFSVYDGETRTYTVTVQQIPSWATGVRVLIECINQNDPNVGGNSGTGGGNGTFDDSSDSVPIEAMPSISAADAGLITLFKPTLSELKELGAYLWTNITDFIENLQKIFSNPMDVIIALNILPGSPPTNSARNIRLGLWETNISMAPVQSQWYEIDFGNVRISEYWGSALDYSPNTKIHAMLPFIGSVQLDTDDIMDKVVSLVYRIDLLSGHLVAIMTVNDDVLYQFTGECAVAVPLTGADWSRVYGAIAGTLGAITVGAAGAVAGGAAASGISQTASIAQTAAAQADFDYMAGNITAMEHRQLQAAAAQAVGRKNAGEAAKAAGAAALASNTVNQIMGGKLQIAHSGTISGSAGLLGNRTPYIYIEYPNQSMAENYKHFYGYPSNMYANLSGLRGYTQCYQVLLTGVNGTDGEIAEILNLLKEGVYL